MLTIPTATVMRNGIQEDIEAYNLVPGDIVVLEEGNKTTINHQLTLL